jgi:predicted ATP-grasp superfamily ATP-dependent carboligase
MQSLTVLGYSVRALANSAARAGFAPYAIDAFADRDLVATCPTTKIERYPRDLPRALAAAPSGPWMYTGGLENHPALLDHLAQIRPLWGDPASVVRSIRRPAALAQVAQAAGCRFPQLNPPKGLALVKPRRGSGGAEIRFANDQDYKKSPRGCCLQQYVSGQPASAVFVAAGGRALLLGATQQLIGADFNLARPFLYAGSVGPLDLTADITSALHRLGSILALEFNLHGLFNADFVISDGELWLLEVNPRYSASIEVLERASCSSFVALHADACNRGELPNDPPAVSGRYFGKAIVYAEHPGVVPAAFDDLAQTWLKTDVSPGLADIPHVGEKLTAGQPVVTVLASSHSPAAALTTLQHRVIQVQKLLRGQASS